MCQIRESKDYSVDWHTSQVGQVQGSEHAKTPSKGREGVERVLPLVSPPPQKRCSWVRGSWYIGGYR